MNFPFETKLDFFKAVPLTNNIRFSEGDINTAKIQLRCLSNGIKVDLTGSRATANVQTSSKKVTLSVSVINATEGIVELNFPTNTLEQGTNSFEVVLTKGSDTKVSPRLYYSVRDSIGDDGSVAGETNYPILIQLLGEVNATLETFNKNEEGRKTTFSNNEKKRQDDFESGEAARQELFEMNEQERQDTVAETIAARTDAFGVKHSKLKPRLDADFDYVRDKIDEISYLPYEGENGFTANNSKPGNSCDVLVEGNTLVNLTSRELGSPFAQNMVYSYDNSKNEYSLSKTINNYPSFGVTFPYFKENTDYTIIFTHKVSRDSFPFRAGLRNRNGSSAWNVQGIDFTSTTTYKTEIKKINSSDFASLGFAFSTRWNNWDGKEDVVIYLKDIICLEGDYTDKPIEYFEGLKSVGQTNDNKIEILACGENLFNYKKEFSSKPTNTNVSNGVSVKEIEDGLEIIGKGWYGYYVHEFFLPKGTYNISVDMNYMAVFGVRDITTNTTLVHDVGHNTDVGIKRLNWTKQLQQDCVIKVEYKFRNTGDTPSIFKNMQITRTSTVKDYTPYQSNKTDISLSQPLRSLPNGVKDTVEIVDGKCVVTRRCGEVVISGNESTWALIDAQSNTLVFGIGISGGKNAGECISDKFIYKYSALTDDIERIRFASSNGTLYIQILKSKLATQDVAGFKTWLASNPITVVYELTTPIKEEIHLNDLNIYTYENQTNVFVDGGAIPTKISMKVPSFVAAVVSALREENESLSYENQRLRDGLIEHVEYVDESQLVQDEEILTSLLASTELFEMVLMLFPMTRNIEEKSEVFKMVEVYVTLIVKGEKTLEQVPAIIRGQVEAQLKILGVIA